MHAHGRWNGRYETVLDDGRGHGVTVDLTRPDGGGDAGASALELSVLSLAGCITTVFALVAEKRRLKFDALTIDLDATRPHGAPTITSVDGVLRITTSASRADVQTALDLTLRTCPAGVMYERAGIPVRLRTILTASGSRRS